ncbi:hypothetical protein G3I59_26665 [Amycolatopsis rubida]|uniref:DUF3093 domain-containing protein n=1 Tax=Amycolatopsis rubida TaxID=112413 RepID=A0ABX0BXY7_9PSEU|nr:MULTISPECIES: hypothetical protein [Amycolatopsis]MYW94093.1 hypothetical protein [Amycolatopsis rubida]NEC59082.1 hypothetical protein [Amycolatopsis rubida]OAP22033.1 hypothetical protein A4R44_07150 [Amycolatopsis sp. M39]
MAARTLYSEPGVGWSALIWGPLFALLGALAELATGGPTHVVGWVLIGAALCGLTLPWVYARRRFLSLEVTTEQVRQGRETVAAERIASVTDVGAPVGTRVLGGGWSVPRKYDELPVELDDGTVVLAWARDVEALKTALAELAAKNHPEDENTEEQADDFRN